MLGTKRCSSKLFYQINIEDFIGSDHIENPISKKVKFEVERFLGEPDKEKIGRRRHRSNAAYLNKRSVYHR